MEAGLEELKECRACPRDCGVDRLSDKMGACNTGRMAIVRYNPHSGHYVYQFHGLLLSYTFF